MSEIFRPQMVCFVLEIRTKLLADQLLAPSHRREQRGLRGKVEASMQRVCFANQCQNYAFQVLCKSWTKQERSWNTVGPPSPMLLWPHPCAARLGRPCSQGSTCITTMSTRTMRTALLPRGRQCMSLGHLLCISITLATEQVKVTVSSSIVLDEGNYTG